MRRFSEIAKLAAGHHGGPKKLAAKIAEHPGDAVGMVLVGGDDETTRIGLLLADLTQPVVGLAEHRGDPVAVEAQCGAEAGRHLIAGQLVVERRP